MTRKNFDIARAKTKINLRIEEVGKGKVLEGKNFVFDSRVAVPSITTTTFSCETEVEKEVGLCIDCQVC